MPLRAILFELNHVLLDEWGGYAALDATMAAVRARFALTDPADELSGEFSLRLMDLIAAEPPPALPGEADDSPPAEFQPFEMAAKEILVEILDARGFAAGPADTAWFWDTLLREHRAHARAHADAAKALADLAGEVRLAVVTDTDPALAAALLEGAGLAPRLEAVVTAKDAGYVKPSPKLFEAALDRLRVDAAEALMVGASYERDVLGAQRAGMRALLVDRHNARMVPPEEKVRTLKALPERVRGLLSPP